MRRARARERGVKKWGTRLSEKTREKRARARRMCARARRRVGGLLGEWVVVARDGSDGARKKMVWCWREAERSAALLLCGARARVRRSPSPLPPATGCDGNRFQPRARTPPPITCSISRTCLVPHPFIHPAARQPAPRRLPIGRLISVSHHHARAHTSLSPIHARQSRAQSTRRNAGPPRRALAAVWRRQPCEQRLAKRGRCCCRPHEPVVGLAPPSPPRSQPGPAQSLDGCAR